MSWSDILRKIAPVGVALIPGAAGALGSVAGLSGTAANVAGGAGLGALTGALLGKRTGRDALLGGALGAAAAGLAPTVMDFFSSKAPVGPVAQEALFMGMEDGVPQGWTEGMSGPVEALVETAPKGGALTEIASNAAEPSFFEKYKTPLVLGGGALLLGGLGGDEESSAPVFERPQERPMPTVNFNRRMTAPTTAAPYYTFGTVPFSFYDDNYVTLDDETPGGSAGDYARGGGAGGRSLSTEPRYIAEGPGSGRDDMVDARVSPGEYVMDAESVALAGDGNPDEGARELDKLRVRLRKDKGKELVKGKFSRNAKPLHRYMGGGR